MLRPDSPWLRRLILVPMGLSALPQDLEQVSRSLFASNLSVEQSDGHAMYQNTPPQAGPISASNNPSHVSACGDAGHCCCTPNGQDRRNFLHAIGVTGAGLAVWQSAIGAIAGPFDAEDAVDHFVPADKKLAADWIKTLFARGSRTWYTGEDLATIGMPIGGICAGQVYLTGDGRLVYWDIFNSNHNTGYGAVNYKVGRKPTEVVAENRDFIAAPRVDQGVAMLVSSGGRKIMRTLDAAGFPQVRFCGEYPLGDVDFVDESLPVAISLRAFSPFIPLNSADSALPATVLRYTVQNTSDADAEVSVVSWLENAVLLHSGAELAEEVVRHNELVKDSHLTAVACTAKVFPKSDEPVRDPIVFANFESGNYGQWEVSGEAFGNGPAAGTLPNQQEVTGYHGKGLVNSFLGGDDRLQGKLVSPPFTVERPWISFLIGGGPHAERTCANLVVDGKVLYSATGHGREELVLRNWNVKELIGRQARIEIVDSESGGWGHVNVDQIEFGDVPRSTDALPTRRRSDYGSTALGVVGDEDCFATVRLQDVADLETRYFSGRSALGDSAEEPLEKKLVGSVGQSVLLKPGENRTITFVIGWHMPNNYRDRRWVGNNYAKRFANAVEVVRYVANNFDRLTAQTRLWHEVYYDSTLPRWLLDRIGATVCNLATGTCQWWQNGRFWAWEGVGCCHGTCGHVWNYEHSLARLFPELERSVRTMQDFAPGIGFNPQTGSIGFRGEGWDLWAGDAQGGYILKAYREHQCSASAEFLKENWPVVRRAVEFLIEQDQNADGLIEGRQHQTYDQDYYGANTFVGSLYLGALRAAEEMAREVGDVEFSQQCRTIFGAGRDNSVECLYNGEYFVQDVDLEKHPDWQYGDGCLADQMFGQGWAHHVGLGYLYPPDMVRQTLTSIWKYCWAPDIAAQNEHHKPERWYARPGEAGLFTCTWPRSKHLGPKSTRYRNEVWTGIEYQVASHMAWEGMLTECLAICRAVHERYHPAKHNPYNEIECGDHYARALASWGVLTGLSGFEYHGPQGHVGFAPRITPEDFKAVFTTAEGWGSFSQTADRNALSGRIEMKWGQLRLRSVKLDLPPDTRLTVARVTTAGADISTTTNQEGRTVTLQFEGELLLETPDSLQVELQLA